MDQLLACVLTEDVAERFTITAVALEGKHRLTIALEERNIPPDTVGIRIESKGFLPERTVQDFPLRDRAVTLRIRCRRWRNAETGTEVHVPLTLTAPGTSFLKEFGDFLKVLDREDADRHRHGR
jgi:hypothetical protein